jgi:hypothetical protein
VNKLGRKHVERAKELLKQSATVTAAETLRTKAEAAVRDAEKAEQARRSDYTQFQRIPAKAEELQNRLAAINAERDRMTVSDLENAYREVYSARLVGKLMYGDLNTIYAEIQQVPGKLEILMDTEATTVGELTALKATDRELSKKLNTKPHDL